MKNKLHLGFFFTMYAAYCTVYFARVNLSMASPVLKAARILDAAQIGVLGGVFSVLYAIGRLLFGRLGDCVAPWKLIAGGLMFVAVSQLLFSLFPSYAAMLILWGINALAQSMIWSPILRQMAVVYYGQLARKMASLLVTAVATGNIIGILATTVILRMYSPGAAFIVPGIVALLLCFLSALVAHSIFVPKHLSQPSGGKRLIANREIRKMMLPAALHGVMKDNISLWMAVYVVDCFGLNLEESSWYVLLIPLAGLAGRLLYPPLCRLFRNNDLACARAGAIMSFLACIPLMLGGGSALLSVICMSVIYAAVSIINTYVLSIFPFCFCSEGAVSSVSGLMDFATYLGAGISSFGFSLLVNSSGYGSMFMVWAICSAACLALFAQKSPEQSMCNS